MLSGRKRAVYSELRVCCDHFFVLGFPGYYLVIFSLTSLFVWGPTSPLSLLKCSSVWVLGKVLSKPCVVPLESWYLGGWGSGSWAPGQPWAAYWRVCPKNKHTLSPHTFLWRPSPGAHGPLPTSTGYFQLPSRASLPCSSAWRCCFPSHPESSQNINQVLSFFVWILLAVSHLSHCLSEQISFRQPDHSALRYLSDNVSSSHITCPHDSLCSPQ